MADLEPQLIEEVKQGSRSAFYCLVEKHRDKAFSLCYSITYNYEDAKDILQEAFIRVYQGAKDFRQDSSFNTWFYRIIINLCRDYLRKKAKSASVFVEPIELQNDDAQDYDIIVSAKDKNPNPRQEVLANELNNTIDSAISFLPEKQRLVFILKHIEGMKLDEIASVLKCRTSTVKVHLFRAVRNLQRLLHPYIASQL